MVCIFGETNGQWSEKTWQLFPPRQRSSAGTQMEQGPWSAQSPWLEVTLYSLILSCPPVHPMSRTLSLSLAYTHSHICTGHTNPVTAHRDRHTHAHTHSHVI